MIGSSSIAGTVSTTEATFCFISGVTAECIHISTHANLNLQKSVHVSINNNINAPKTFFMLFQTIRSHIYAPYYKRLRRTCWNLSVSQDCMATYFKNYSSVKHDHASSLHTCINLYFGALSKKPNNLRKLPLMSKLSRFYGIKFIHNIHGSRKEEHGLIFTTCDYCR